MQEFDKKGPTQEEKSPTEGLTLEEDKQIQELLSKIEPGFISVPVFTELARIKPLPVVEVVIFRKNNGVTETLLIPRPSDDIKWLGKIHSPGTAFRSEDYKKGNPLKEVFDRIQNGEINTNFEYDPIFVTNTHPMTKRGPGVAEIYYTKLPKGVDKDHYIWCPVDELAENEDFIQGQLEHVLLAAEKYESDI